MITLRLQKTLWGASGPMLLDIDTTLESGQIITLYGKSGAGKTSLLRIIAGLMTPEQGYLSVDDEVWLDTRAGVQLAPQQRKVGLVFQDYALFPNMTVEQNLRFALGKHGDPSVVTSLIELMELGDLRQRKPATLSGGQQQRVALARALVQQPRLLLLDEPLSALDHAMRQRLQDYLLTLHRSYPLTILLVSHDLSEILRLSSVMLVLDNGRITRKGTPVEVLTPRTGTGRFQFTGEIVSIDQQDIVCIVAILIGKDLVRVVADPSEVRDLQPGTRVMVASKAFNPVITRLAE
ncbi:MAG: ATP-binding cassette domain-containing protein [Saprospiraceae bacterium]|nr:ATP-binding cassette domain-containing protein [Saprospiraceae bacterium]